ncbi:MULTISPECIES: hypothetical protein [Bacillus]|uniref:hypothetical protein n=1 Tax=Bacillus TaxID=1386 RepID=UPI0004DB110E|nr:MULTISPECIES: hypothetical protein [Bacillus]KEP28573.1 hypothetical protein ER50_18345 [Bacillus safensis]MCY8927753.1 hypothetical protein [Bacillus subtilis]
MWSIPVLIILSFIILNYWKTKRTYMVASVHVLFKTKKNMLSMIFLNSERMKEIKEFFWKISIKELEQIVDDLSDEYERKNNFTSKSVVISVAFISSATACLSYILALVNIRLNLFTSEIQSKVKEMKKSGEVSVNSGFLNPDENTKKLLTKAIKEVDSFVMDTMIQHLELIIVFVILICLYLLYRRITVRLINKLYFAAKRVYEDRNKYDDELKEVLEKVYKFQAISWKMTKIESELLFIIIYQSDEKQKSETIVLTDERLIEEVKQHILNKNIKQL